jgi:hypothetical protein
VIGFDRHRFAQGRCDHLDVESHHLGQRDSNALFCRAESLEIEPQPVIRRREKCKEITPVLTGDCDAASLN